MTDADLNSTEPKQKTSTAGQVKTVLTVVLVGLLAYTVINYSRYRGMYGAAVKVGDHITDFSLPVLGGDAPRALSSFKARRLLLVFWGPSCASCIEELKLLTSHAGMLKSKGVQVVTLTHREGADFSIPNVVKKLGMPFPVLLDDGAVMRTFGVSTIPLNVVLDDHLEVHAYQVGSVPMKELFE